jgi:hypothetical protein
MKELLILIAEGLPWTKVTQHHAYAGLAYRMRSIIRRDKEGKITFRGAAPLDMFLRGEQDRGVIVSEGFKCLKARP